MMTAAGINMTVSLQQLMQSIDAKAQNELAKQVQQIESIAIDSRKVEHGALFCAVVGTQQDGHDFVDAAAKNGAIAVLIQQDRLANYDVKNANFAVFTVDNVAQKLGALASAFYAHPGRYMKLAGITGTNGKTTVAYALAQAMQITGQVSGYLGTIGNGLIDSLEDSKLTTADAISVQRFLATLQAQGAAHVALEVSSHALSQYRVDGCDFDAVVFTNLSQDHLDYHGSMDAYAAAKKRLFSEFAAKIAVINLDDEFAAAQLLQNSALRTITYGEHEHADLRLLQYTFSHHESLLTVRWQRKDITLRIGLIGRFNAANMLAVVAVLLGYGHSLDEIAKILPKIKAPAGRMQWFKAHNKPLVVVDYAHTPDALAQVLMTLREICKGELVVCFGCGGDRDRSKRPKMGQVAERYADHVCVTDDNPRTESADQIVEDILSGLTKPALVEHNRAQAIEMVIKQAGEDDVVLIAGKGHETYQIVGHETLPFDDCQQVKQVLGVAA